MTETPLTILVVEDEALIRMDLALGLSDLGHKVLEAGNADMAMQTLRDEEAIDVLVTDIDMPGEMDGLDLAGKVRGLSETCRIVVMSGRSHPTQDALPEHSTFLGKPLDVDDIMRAIA
ncbi:response regulator [Marinibacterium profundimaris]|uniref:Response regulatory domain-containing protein n=1 Tax=Marinibacterium profundimaris TaxID=1679460 RepID=A0A225NMX0_9RHOB|nr:response regulator [Marinibacterium profundimaris]OWU75639.1 hypothetical protein ATO3_05345 [Marinibacterium profundimaris]